MVDFMSNNKPFARGLLTGVNGSDENKKKWGSLTAELNACGGCIKTPDQWKKVLFTYLQKTYSCKNNFT